ncbi:MAG: DegT/DnrJ/EryC1/StrS family aminotransferase [Pirellulales bacterium]
MWPRKQLDISWLDFAFASAQIFSPAKRLDDDAVAGPGWIPAGEALVSLSVRSAWDLLLSALRLPAGSEIVMSAVTVPDMARIVEHHGLVPVPVDVDPLRLEPVLAELEQAITPRTRAILVAHLFGSRIDMTPIIELASKHNLLVVEDCAQAFIGREYAGHRDSDVCLFSFGPIKTATALGGAITRVRDRALLAEMSRRQQEYPVQKRRSYLSRIAKFIGIRLFTTRPVYSAAVAYARKRGLDYDHKIAGLARSFAADRLFQLIRRQPSTPLVKMLQWRIATYEGSAATRLRRRTERSSRVAKCLSHDQFIGAENPTHTYWVFPIRTTDANVVESLQTAGFDATRLSSLVVVPPLDTVQHSTNGSPQRLATWLDETVYLPNCDAIPDAEFDRLAAILSSAIGDTKPVPPAKREPADRPRVIVAP